MRYEGRQGRRLTVERALIGHVVNEENAHSTPVIGGSDGAESLLSSSVPLSWVA